MGVDVQNLPRHVAITMDGNGRWAQSRKLPRTSGHDEGLKTAKEIVRAASDVGLEFLTLYVFSTENWKRAEAEVGFLMNLIHVHLKGELDFYRKNQIRIRHIGDAAALPGNIREDLADCIRDTAFYTGLTVNLAINYGGRDEIVRGVRRLLAERNPAEKVTEDGFSAFLDMPDVPDVDLLIRTGGEQRLSNFLLWHVAYAELIFKDTLWPDYSEKEFLADLEAFRHRNRRFGAEK